MTHQFTSDQTNPTALPHQAAQREIIIYGHTTLFLWWPVWSVGFADSEEVARPYSDFNAPMISPESAASATLTSRASRRIDDG